MPKFRVVITGMALIVNDGEPEIVGELENCMRVSIGSLDDNGWEHPETSHVDIKKLLGKRVRVTIEVLD